MYMEDVEEKKTRFFLQIFNNSLLGQINIDGNVVFTFGSRAGILQSVWCYSVCPLQSLT